jgi:hypothetical protein
VDALDGGDRRANGVDHFGTPSVRDIRDTLDELHRRREREAGNGKRETGRKQA